MWRGLSGKAFRLSEPPNNAIEAESHAAPARI
jgi:hypothetical protein